MLPGTGFGDDAGLAHALGQQGLPQNVVDLVRTGVVEVFTFEEDPGPAGVLGEVLGFGEEGRPARVVLVQVLELREELGVGLGLLEGVLDFVQGGDERFRHPASAVAAEVWPRGVLQRTALQESLSSVVVSVF